MKFAYRERQWNRDDSAFLLTNGLGGYCSLAAAFSAPRCDQGLLVAAMTAPNRRINLVHRLSESLLCGQNSAFLSAQKFADGRAPENGDRYLTEFIFDGLPVWHYECLGVQVVRRCCIEHGHNTVAVLYELENRSEHSATFQVTPWFKFAPKEEPVQQEKKLYVQGTRICSEDQFVTLNTNGVRQTIQPSWQQLAYPEDAKDGRPDRGIASACLVVTKTVEPGQRTSLELVFSTEETAPSAQQLIAKAHDRLKELENSVSFSDPVARQLALSADAYIARRDSTDGKTILAGYPLFSDWGRDTMIALPGCVLATGRFEDARSILKTFLAYEKDGLVPNLFPEGNQAPMYNTVDAALLLIDCVWQYLRCTGDLDFVRQAWDTLEHIVCCYREGTHHGIGMDTDGLIYAGKGMDQVTWMDVCVQGILPTPRHGKPVEINAYWYNALRIMDLLARKLEKDPRDYESLARKVKAAFVKEFYMPHRGYLKDVLSSTEADTQIRCNQVWALTQSFPLLEGEPARKVLETVKEHLYTPFGLRTLSPEDPQYHSHYGGSQLERDLAYHQGTVWVFPLGAFYRAWLQVEKGSPEAVKFVTRGLENLKEMLYDGCAGQLPEIYDGDDPGEGKGCFAQAWSVGEILRVYQALEEIREERNAG